MGVFDWFKGKVDEVQSIPEQQVVLEEAVVTGLNAKVNELKNQVQTLSHKSLFGSNVGYEAKSLLGSIYSSTVQRKSDVVRKVQGIQENWFAIGITDLIINDAISEDIITKDIISIESENKIINNEIKELSSKIDFDALVRCVAEPMLHFGEYFVGVESEDGIGVTGLVDNLDQSRIVAIHKDFKPFKYLEESVNDQDVDTIDSDKMAHFCLGNRRLRITIGNRKTPEYIRMGRSIFWGLFDLLKSVELLCALVPASYLQTVNAKSIMAIQVPEKTSPKDAFEITKHYDDLLNQLVSFDPTTGNITVSDVLSQAGKYKCLAVWGSGKGTLSDMNTKGDTLMDLSTFDDLKRSILATIGVPYGFMFGGQSNKGELLKQFSRYVKKLNSIQQAIAEGVRQIVYIHLEKKGLKPVQTELKVKFVNALVSVEELDRVEFLDVMMGALGNLVGTLTDIDEKLDGFVIDDKEMQMFLNKYLRPIDLERLFKKASKEDEPKEPKGDDEEPEEEPEEEPDQEEPDDKE